MPEKSRRRPPPRGRPPVVSQKGVPVPQEFGSNQDRLDEMLSSGSGGKDDDWMTGFLEERYNLAKVPGGYGPKSLNIGEPKTKKAPEKKKSFLSMLNPLNWFKSGDKSEEEAAPKPLPGLIDPDQLTVKDKLGKGATGIAYKAGLQDEDVVAKFPVGEENNEVIEEEIRNTASLPVGEKNLLKFRGSTNRKGSPGMLTELAPHGDLQQLNDIISKERKDKPKTDKEDLRLRLTTRDAIRGLQALHTRNLVHGDVKGGNIMLGEDYTAKLGDFGTLQKEGRKGEKGDIGTDAYSAPENLTRVPTKKSDMWAMGETLLHGLTGRTSVGMMTGMDKPGSTGTNLTSKKAQNPDFFKEELPEMLKKREVDPRAVSLLQGLLESDPDKRLGASQALQSEFLTLTPEEEIEAKAQLAKTLGGKQT